MKIQKFFTVDNETIGWSEIESLINDTYEVRSAVDKILEVVPTAKIKVTFNLDVEIS